MKQYYPLMIDLNDRSCVVIGGGKVAERKIESLLAAGGIVTTISPEATPKIEKLFSERKITWEQRGYNQGDLKGHFLVIIATDNPVINSNIYQDVNHAIQLVNIVDSPNLCTFIVPSTVKRGHLQIAISTQGASPGLAKTIRQKLEKQYGEEYEEYTDFLAKMRMWILQNVNDPKKRRNYFEQLLDKKVFHRILNGERKTVAEEFKSKLL